MRNILFKCMFGTAILCGSVAFAQNAPSQGKSGEHFQQHKQMMLDRIGKRIERLQAFQSCVQAAGDRTALKTCRETFRAQQPHAGGQR